MHKLLQINSVVNSGSTGRIAEQINKKAIENNWSSYIAYGRFANKSTAKLIKVGTKKDFYFHIFKSFVLGQHGLASKEATLVLIESIKNINPDIIHLHNIHGYYLNYEILFEFLKDFKGKIVWTLHDCWSFTGHCTYFSDINCTKWISGCENCPKVKNYPSSLIFDTSKSAYFSKKSNFSNLKNLQIVTVSNWLQSLVSKSFLKDHPVQTIHNGVDLQIFDLKERNQNLLNKYHLSDKFVMLAAATSWSKHKGFDDYLKLASFLAKDEVLILIGLSQEIIKILPLNVIGISKTESQEELADWYNSTHVVLNLSYQETFGMTSVEGFACGKPTIVYNATASPELVSREELGYIIEPGNVSEVYDAVKKIKKNGQTFYSKSCRNTALENYNMDVQYQKYVALYENLITS